MDSEEGIQRVSRELQARTRRLGLLLKPATKLSFLRVVIVNERRDDGFIYIHHKVTQTRRQRMEEALTFRLMELFSLRIPSSNLCRGI